MGNFFSRFKNHLNFDYGGRYLEVILCEVIKDDLSLLKVVFPEIEINISKSKSIDIAIEDLFPSKFRTHRRADLVVKENGIHKALLEIKYKDEPQEFQIEDYLKYSKKNGICFTYLTQYIPKEEDLNLIRNMQSNRYVAMLFSGLFRKIKDRKKNNPVTQLFLNFLEEEFMIYNQEINEDALHLLLIKGLSLKNRSGLGKKVSDANIKSIPPLWDILINNLGILGDRFYNDFRGLFKNRFSYNFGFDPEFSLRLLEKDINNIDDEKTVFLKPERKVGGNFWISASGKMKQPCSDDWLYVAIGYSFSVELKKKKYSKFLYSGVFGKGFEDVVLEKKINRLGLPEENVCYKELLKLCRECVDQVLHDNKTLCGTFINTLTDLKKQIIVQTER
jgi:hypothetical protein